MRYLLLILLAAQGSTITGKWVGPLELTVQVPTKVRGAIPTTFELTQQGDRITGSWRSLRPNTQSGTISGTLSQLDIVFYTDSTEQPERCQAVIHATARLTAADMYRIEAKRMIPDQRQNKLCGNWPTDLVWLLQRAEH